MKDRKNRREFLKNTSLATLGLGMIPQICNAKKPQEKTEDLSCEPTTLDYYGQGPFYTDSPPEITDNILAPTSEPGQRLIISGRVMNLECSQFIPDAIVDVWHANDAGQYDNTGYNLRGFTKTNGQGFYLYETILPGKYLNGAKYRPSHIHYKITPPGFPTLTTQLYFQGDEDIPGDAAASINSGQYDATNRTIALAENAEGKLEGTFDIMINGEGISTGLNDIHLDKGILYATSPNPFDEELEIRYGVFRKAKVGLSVFDLQGRLVAELEDREMPPQKYSVNWRPEAGLPKGHYFIALRINDLQVHYQKVSFV